MYEIIEKTTEKQMYIHVPYTENHKCRMALDRYNYIKAGYGIDKDTMLVHIDGDYRNCEPDNMYLIEKRHGAFLKALLANAESLEARELGFAVFELIQMINERAGDKKYYAYYCYRKRRNADPIAKARYNERRRNWAKRNPQKVSERAKRAYEKRKSIPEKWERLKECQRLRYKERMQTNPEYKEKRSAYFKARLANETPEERRKRLDYKRERKALHKEQIKEEV